MHLGKEGSRNRTKATMRIMRLMLSLSPGTPSTPGADHGNVPQKAAISTSISISDVTSDADKAGILFHSALAEITSTSSPSITAGSHSTSGGGTSSNFVQTQATDAVTTPNITADKATAEPHVSAQTQSQSSTINNPSSSHSSISSAPPTVSHAAATLSPPNAKIPITAVATADSGGTSVGFPATVIVQTPEASVASTNSMTEPSVMPTTGPYHTETSKIPTYPTTEQTHAAITKTSEGDTKKTTVPVTTNWQIKSTTKETGKPGTTSTPPTLTTGSPVSENLSGTTFLQTSTAATTDPLPKIFLYSLNSRPEKDQDKVLVEVCKRLMANLQDGNCTVILGNGTIPFNSMEINGKVKTSIFIQYYEEITKKPTDNKTLIAILASCGALLIMIFILAICASHHRRSYNENQQHLTEELHTVENGYHDNPTLEVMEVHPEMQEKKVALNGEFNNDSWIVPIDNLLKEDILDEEDTHL